MSSKELFHEKTNPEIGRYAVAKENLQPGDLIFEELPFAYGPKADSPTVCLGCYRPVDGLELCSKCFWPICSNSCKTISTHYENECEIFSSTEAKFQKLNNPNEVCLQYECITPLRVLLASEKAPTRWQNEVMTMESHNKIRQQKPIWHFNSVNIVQYLRGPCKLQRFSEDLIHTVCGILEVNAFEARSESGNHVRCLYPKLAILSHSCVSNICHAIRSSDFLVKVRATVPVLKNEELYSSYAYPLLPTLLRRTFLKESKYFECKCRRCCDQTEIGSHSGTLICADCPNSGFVLSMDPLKFDSAWKCTKCGCQTPAENVQNLYKEIQEEIDKAGDLSGGLAIEQLELSFQKYQKRLHPRNSFMTMLKLELIKLYGRTEGCRFDQLNSTMLKQMIRFSNEALSVLDIIEPGLSRIRGVTLYQLQCGVFYLNKNLYKSGTINKSKLDKEIGKVLSILKKSLEILEQQDLGSSEGQLGLMARKSYNTLIKTFDKF